MGIGTGILGLEWEECYHYHVKEVVRRILGIITIILGGDQRRKRIT